MNKDMEKLAELVDASLKFTRVLKKKGVSQATLQVRAPCAPAVPSFAPRSLPPPPPSPGPPPRPDPPPTSSPGHTHDLAGAC